MADTFLRKNETALDLYDRCTNLSTFNCSEEEMLWVVIGPRRLPLAEIVPISLVLLVIFLTGAVGNAAVCVVIARHKAMQTATNYYLFSLAVSDLMLLFFGLPNDLTVYWHQYPYSLGVVFCKLRALISEAASYVSVLTIVAFSLERYLAICHPLHLYAMAGLRRALRIVAGLWVVSLVAASPFAVYTTVNYHDYPPGSGNRSLESAFCAMLELPSWYLCELSSLLFFVLPGIIILALYVRMGLRIRSTHAHKPGSPGTLNGVNGSVHGEARQAQSKKAIIRMLECNNCLSDWSLPTPPGYRPAVVITFYVCWAPFHIQRLFFIYGRRSPYYATVNEYLFSVAGAFYYVSATVNPILYNVMSHRYRLAFRDTLCCARADRGKCKSYREHSSVRESSVHHNDGAHLVRVRSQLHRGSRIEHKVFRRSSFYSSETTALCNNTPSKWNHDCFNENKSDALKMERLTQPRNNNAEKTFEKIDERPNVNSEVDKDINIQISIHLRK